MNKKLFKNGEHQKQKLVQQINDMIVYNKRMCVICFDKDNLMETICNRFICKDCIKGCQAYTVISRLKQELINDTIDNDLTVDLINI